MKFEMDDKLWEDIVLRSKAPTEGEEEVNVLLIRIYKWLTEVITPIEPGMENDEYWCDKCKEWFSDAFGQCPESCDSEYISSYPI